MPASATSPATFSTLPRESKRQFLRTRDNPWGYYDRELTKEKRDKKEIFDIGPDVGSTVLGHAPFVGTNADSPTEPAAFAGAIHDYFEARHRARQPAGRC